MVYDMVFIGGGLASCLISRYLKLKNPQLKILVIAKESVGQWAPGESTVSLAGLFLVRDLQLSTYMYLNHLPKNGLRYFFSPRESATSISAHSEIGSNSIPVFPTFQIDRKTIVEDLWKMNESIGIEHRLGYLACSVTHGNGLHSVSMSDGGGITDSVSTRWLVMSAGRFGPLDDFANSLSPKIKDQDHLLTAAWGRFSNVKDIDQSGDIDWQNRVGYTSRYLSTNHIMGNGYWIWVIPIGSGVVSFGVVFAKPCGFQINDLDGLRSFLMSNSICADLLADAHGLDFQRGSDLAFRRSKFVTENRIAFVGDSLMFVDPFYSPGSDTIARQAHLLNMLLSNNQTTTIADLNAFVQFDYELLKSLYVRQYPGFESFEVFNIKSLWDFYSYTNRVLYFFFNQSYQDPNWIRAQLETKTETLNQMYSIQNAFIDLYNHLKAGDKHIDKNKGRLSLRQNRFKIETQMLMGRHSAKDSAEHHLNLVVLVLSELIEARFGIVDFAQNRFIQECLKDQSTGFELSETWLTRFLRFSSKRLSLWARRELGATIYCHIEFCASSKQLILSLADSTDPSLVAKIRSFWDKPAVNVVANQLL